MPRAPDRNQPAGVVATVELNEKIRRVSRIRGDEECAPADAVGTNGR